MYTEDTKEPNLPEFNAVTYTPRENGVGGRRSRELKKYRKKKFTLVEHIRDRFGGNVK